MCVTHSDSTLSITHSVKALSPLLLQWPLLAFHVGTCSWPALKGRGLTQGPPLPNTTIHSRVCTLHFPSMTLTSVALVWTSNTNARHRPDKTHCVNI